MKAIWIITKRELNSHFDSLMAYILLIVFLGFNGFFTWFFRNAFFEFNQASLQIFFNWSYWSLFFIIPGITMRTLAEERNSGTIEMLSTKAITNWQIVCGKFLSSWLLVIFALILTLPYFITVIKLGDIDAGATIMGYFGLLLISGLFISIGIFASSISKNQVIAFILAMLISFFFQFIFGESSQLMKGSLGMVLNYLSTNVHFESMARGVVDSRDLLYFISIIFTGLFLAHFNLSKRILIS